MKRTLAATLLALAASPALATELSPIYTTGDATVCFTTGNKSTIGGDCAAVLVAEIEKAERELLVQAYNFTEPRIIAAIIAAHRRAACSSPSFSTRSARARRAKAPIRCMMPEYRRSSIASRRSRTTRS
jgi:L-aminopeptidase/D-esterase-like protein